MECRRWFSNFSTFSLSNCPTPAGGAVRIAVDAMGGALLGLGRIPGVARAGIAVVVAAGVSHPGVLLDVGANVDCRPHHLLQFAIMGAVYARRVLEIHTPHIGILSNGAEEGKGSDLTLRTTALLRDSGLDFIGNVESRDVFSGVADVVVCDGFVGNVVLKFGEGLALAIRDIVKSELRGLRGRLALLYLAPLAGKIRRMYRRIDYREYGGAPLLGLEGVCVIAHGSSNARAIRNAIRVAVEAVRHGVVDESRAQMPRWSDAALNAGAPASPGLRPAPDPSANRP